MMIDHDKFLPAVVMMSHTPCHVNICRQYHSTHYNSSLNTALGITVPKCTAFPLPGKSQRTHLSTVNVHNARQKTET
jgi:hypothetical protein